MKRVLMVSCEGLGKGGVQAIMMGIIRSLSSQYHFDMLLFTNEERYYEKEFLSYGGEIFRIPRHVSNYVVGRRLSEYTQDIYFYTKTKQLLQNQPSYDVIHCNREFESASIIKAAADIGIPVRICHTHVIASNSGRLIQILNKIRKTYISKYATHFIGCSEQACSSFFKKGVNYKVIDNFYDDTKFQFSPLCSENKTIELTQVGAFCDNKNQSFSLHLLRKLLNIGMRVHLNFVGFELQRGYKHRLEQEITQLNLTNRVDFFPEDTDIPRILAGTNALLMPSLKEGFGIALIEAQAVGVICFASSNIPRNADCGNVIYMPIGSNVEIEEWAKMIFEYHKLGMLVHRSVNTEKFKRTGIMKLYSKIYDNR